MTKDELKGKIVAVLGCGVEGESSARYLAKLGARVTVFDQKEVHQLSEQSLHLLNSEGVMYRFGKDAFADVTGFEVIVRSPGIRRSLPEILTAEQQGAVITSQTQLFFELSPAKILGVTGTKGKGTASTLIYEMLKAQGKAVYLGGNIGKPPFTFLDELTPDALVVLELSSFQLEDLTRSPHIAVMLMVTSEHLGADTVGTANYHDSLDSYIEAKRRILKFQTEKDIAILNGDYAATRESKDHTRATVYSVSQNPIAESDGCFVRDGAIWMRMQGVDEKIISTGEILLPGKHNRENVCAASMAARVMGVSLEVIRRVLKTFRGLEHRLELVAEVQGVKYYDDSFSTTPETAIAAIQSFTAPKVLILGGSRKGSDFSELAKVIAHTDGIRAIIGIDVEWERIKEELKSYAKQIHVREGLRDMPSIVKAAAEVAKQGDIVLLSPACASFGLFPNYKVRGDQFKAEVKKLLNV